MEAYLVWLDSGLLSHDGGPSSLGDETPRGLDDNSFPLGGSALSPPGESQKSPSLR